MSSTHFNDSQSDGTVQLPPFGTRVFVGVLDGVVVNVAVAVPVSVGVAVGVLVVVTVGVAVGVFSSQTFVPRLQVKLAMNMPPEVVHVVWGWLRHRLVNTQQPRGSH
jgi:hypothetical protein